MTEIQKKCPKCDGNMVSGFTLDHTYGGRLVPKWYKGSPKKSFWKAISIPSSGGIPIAAFRCSRCGFVEFYSHQDFEAE